MHIQQRVRTGSSFLVSSEKALTFGLGAAEQVDTLTVWWPGGAVDRYIDLPAGNEVHLIEESGQVETIPLSASGQTAQR
jgi:hypothetical protein